MNGGPGAVTPWYENPDRRCATTPVAWWFPPPRASRTKTVQIASLCVGCPVRGQCAADARNRDDRHGIRAGVDLTHVDQDNRHLLLTRIATSSAPGAEPIAVGVEGYRQGPARLIHVA